MDGLDEDLRPGGHSVAGWLPGRLPGLPARVLVASRLYPRLPEDVDPAHPLAALAPDKLYILPDSPHAARVRERADQEITRLLRRVGDDLALGVLGLLTAARGGPLAIADLATLTGSPAWKVRGVPRRSGGADLAAGRPRQTRRATPSPTLANKHRSSVTKMARKYKAVTGTPHGPRKCLEARIERSGRKPLVARFGGIPLRRQRDAVISDRVLVPGIIRHKELVTRLLADRCEICGHDGEVHVHQVRKLADLGKPGQPRPAWAELMARRRRKTLVVCQPCHDTIHAGQPHPPLTSQSPESGVR